MKIILTGSLGHISQPLAAILIEQGHRVTIISSDPGKAQQIIAMGATPAIGNMQDLSFLIRVFRGADAVYCMNPLDFKMRDISTWDRNMDNYVSAIRATSIKRVIVLSGWVVQLLTSVAPEKKFEMLEGVTITFVRPGPFYTNFYHLTNMIRQGAIVSNYGGNDKVAFVAPEDIAEAIAEEMNTSRTGINVRNVASDELTCSEAAQIIGEAIGMPELQWIVLPDEEVKERLIAAGMSAEMAALLIEMQEQMHNGKALKDYYLNRPVLGKRKLRDFAREYAAWYHTNK